MRVNAKFFMQFTFQRVGTGFIYIYRAAGQIIVCMLGIFHYQKAVLVNDYSRRPKFKIGLVILESNIHKYLAG